MKYGRKRLGKRDKWIDNIATNTLLSSVSACPFIGQETIESREAKISLAYGDPLCKKFNDLFLHENSIPI